MVIVVNFVLEVRYTTAILCFFERVILYRYLSHTTLFKDLLNQPIPPSMNPYKPILCMCVGRE